MPPLQKVLPGASAPIAPLPCYATGLPISLQITSVPFLPISSKPSWHTHLYDAGKFTHFCVHPPLLLPHSFISKQLSLSSPSWYPSWHEQLNDPIAFSHLYSQFPFPLLPEHSSMSSQFTDLVCKLNKKHKSLIFQINFSIHRIFLQLTIPNF